MISVGLIGFGTVGTGVYERLQLSNEVLTSYFQDEIKVTRILVKNKQKNRNSEIDDRLFVTDPKHFLNEKFDIVFEAMGGIALANQYIRHFLENGVSVITANKDLIASNGVELDTIARENGAYLGYEAAVAGGIPIINTLKSTLRTTPIKGISGILNGTTNYILTEMKEKERSYTDVLAEAQQLGYAEADPTNDVEGLDAWYKINILSSLVFGEKEKRSIVCRGISSVEKWHFSFAKLLGCTIKLIAHATVTANGVKGYVSPCIIDQNHAFATINGVLNGVCLEGETIGQLLFTGPGAGKEATANSMVEDFVFHHLHPFVAKRAAILPNKGEQVETTLVALFMDQANDEEVISKLASLEANLLKNFESDGKSLSIYSIRTEKVGLLPAQVYLLHGENSHILEKEVVTDSLLYLPS